EGTGLLHATAHLPHRCRRGEGSAGYGLYYGARSTARVECVPRNDQRREAESRHRVRKALALCRETYPARGITLLGAGGPYDWSPAQSRWRLLHYCKRDQGRPGTLEQ